MPEDWCKLLLNLSPKRFYFDDLNELQTNLSRYLNDATVTTSPDESVVLYKLRLKSLIGKFRNEISSSAKTEFNVIGRNFGNLDVVIVNDASSLCLDADGQFLVPASTVPSVLIRFLHDNYEEALIRRDCRSNLLNDIEKLKSICVDNFNLSELNWDLYMNLEAVKVCLEKLSSSQNEGYYLKKLLKGRKVQMSRSYSVLPDGSISIPVNY